MTNMKTPKKEPLVIHESRVSTTGLRFKNRASTTGLTVHCSATKPSQDFTAQGIDRMHRRRGFVCIGYHFIIRRDGYVETGRPVAAEGAHCKRGGRNRTNIGICLIGGISENPVDHRPGWKWNGSDAEANFTPEQMAALGDLLVKLQGDYNIPDDKIEGHRDVPGETKACPSFDVHKWLQDGTLTVG